MFSFCDMVCFFFQMSTFSEISAALRVLEAVSCLVLVALIAILSPWLFMMYRQGHSVSMQTRFEVVDTCFFLHISVLIGRARGNDVVHWKSDRV